MDGQFQLSTERLILRPHQDRDAAFMVSLNSDPEVTRFTSDSAAGRRDAQLDLEGALALVEVLQRQFRERRMGRLIVLHRQTHERIGWCGLKPIETEPRSADLGYRFLRRFWGQGFATEAAKACIHYGFDELELQSVSAEVEAGNQRSIRVLEKLGFAPAGAPDGGRWFLQKS